VNSLRRFRLTRERLHACLELDAQGKKFKGRPGLKSTSESL
jgi:hypothetical protein